jgi:hypothetical protein
MTNDKLSTHNSALSTGNNSQLKKKGPIYEKSFAFALRIVKLAKYLQEEKKELCCPGKCCEVARR